MSKEHLWPWKPHKLFMGVQPGAPFMGWGVTREIRYECGSGSFATEQDAVSRARLLNAVDSLRDVLLSYQTTADEKAMALHTMLEIVAPSEPINLEEKASIA